MSSKIVDYNKNENIELIDIADNKPQNQRKDLKKAIKEIYHEYCTNTSIHGVQYLGENRPIKEKCFWMVVFIISIYCCTILIRSVYLKWNETPVIVSFSEKSTPVWSIPFPAVTICSETKRILNKEGKYMIYLNFMLYNK